MNRCFAIALTLLAPVALGCSTSNSPSDSGTPDSGTVPSQACQDYCTKIMAVCTGNDGQYESQQACWNACKYIPTTGTPSDLTGNSLNCRMSHLALAQTAGVVPHCWHAGPYGYSGSGGCGDNCTSFCQIAVPYCSSDGGYTGASLSTFSSTTQCEADCNGGGLGLFTDAGADGGFYASSNGGPASGNTLDCREYHLSNALTGGTNQNTHCPHAGENTGLTGQPCQ